jgi:asparagine synthase (glutamine-hydrolysing)
MLEPGSYLHIQDDEVEMHRYWDATLEYDREAIHLDKSSVLKNIRDLLRDSVSLRMRADVPFGAFLSGGIDSSSIVALMTEVAEKKVKTFTISFNEKDFSEAEFASLIARKFQTEHTDIRLNAHDFLKLLPDAVAAMDHPSGDGPNTYVVSKVTKESGVTMALSGLGGDELFAGYPVFTRSVDLLDKKWMMAFPKPLRNIGTGILRKIKPGASAEKIAELLNQDYLDLEYSYPLSRQTLLDSHISKLIGKNELPQNAVRMLLQREVSFGSSGFELPFLSRISHAEIRSYMQNTLLRDTDQMSMAHALEVRVPFLDHRLVSFVYGVADPMKYPHSPKQLLVQAMGDLLPKEVVNRPKMGFTFPWAVWMQGELKGYCFDALKKLGKRSIFIESELDKLWSLFLAGDPRFTWSRIWHLVVLSDWLERNGIE